MNNVIFDWLTFSSKIHSLTDLIDLLGLQDMRFESAKGRYCYQDRLTYDGINIYYNGAADMGICVELSGQGCRNFETLGNGDYATIFSEICDNYSDKSDNRLMNISRLDVAYDDFCGKLDLKYLMFAAQNQEYVSRLKDIEVIYSNKGCSVCHGSRLQSNVYVRIYDKKMERKRDDLDHWVRCELKLKDTTAYGFIKLLNSGADIRKTYFDVLNNYLRYVVPTDNTTNASMLSTAPKWLDFIESWEKVSIFEKPGTSYNIMDLDNFVYKIAGGAVKTMVDILGPEQFLDKLYESQKAKKTNPKYLELKRKWGTAENGEKSV